MLLLLPFSGFLYVWLCREVVSSHGTTKSTLSPRHYESSAAVGNAQSRGWRTHTGQDNGSGRARAGASGPHTDSGINPDLMLLQTLKHTRAVRKDDARTQPGNEAIRSHINITGCVCTTAVREPQGNGGFIEGIQHGRSCISGKRTGHNQRQRRSAKSGKKKRRRRRKRSGPQMEGHPPALAQEQDPSGVNGSDYGEDYNPPEPPPDEDPPVDPVDTRPRRRQPKNPFYPLTPEAYGAYAVMIIAAVIFSSGILGNVSVMCIVCHNYYMRSISNSLLANMALWDFVIIFFCLPLVTFHALTNNWLLGAFSCRIIPYLEVASLGVATFTLCALCIDRFRAATHVQTPYEMMENWASTGAKLAVIWVGALLLALPELLIRQLVIEDPESPDVTPCQRCVVRISTDLPDTLYVLGLTYDGARLWWYFGCYFCLPTLFTICSSLLTAHKIRTAERACVRGSKKQIQLESQMNCAVVALAILYGFCTIPENICNILSAYMAAGVPRRTLDILHLVSQLLLFCKSAVNPVLLFCLCRPFTKAFLDCCCCCCVECGPQPQANGNGNAATVTSEVTNIDSVNLELNTTELELSPFSTAHREPSTSYAPRGTHC